MSVWEPIENSIPLDALIKRWENVEIDGTKLDFEVVDQFIKSCQLTAYDKKDWIINAGHKEWRGEKRNPSLGLQDDDPLWPTGNIIFDMQEISNIEKNFISTNNELESEYLSAQSIMKKLGMSPIRFIDMLNGKSGPRLITMWEERWRDDDGFYFETHRLHEIKVHHIDLKEYLREIGFQNSDIDTDGALVNDTTYGEAFTADLKQRLAETEEKLKSTDVIKDARIADLEQQLAEALEQIKASEVRISDLETSISNLSTATRTQSATEARQQKLLEAWQKAFRVMTPVIRHCHTEEPKKYTKAELQSLCSKHGGELSTAQMDFLRELLGDDYVNKTGGAPVQG